MVDSLVGDVRQHFQLVGCWRWDEYRALFSLASAAGDERENPTCRIVCNGSFFNWLGRSLTKLRHSYEYGLFLMSCSTMSARAKSFIVALSMASASISVLFSTLARQILALFVQYMIDEPAVPIRTSPEAVSRIFSALRTFRTLPCSSARCWIPSSTYHHEKLLCSQNGTHHLLASQWQ